MFNPSTYLYDFGLQQSTEWSLEQTPPLTGRIAVITGGAGGIGAEITKQLLLHDIKRVYILARTKSRFETTLAEKWIPELKPHGLSAENIASRLEFISCDLCDLAVVDKVAEHLASTLPRLDILILNAALTTTPAYELSPQGVETIFAANHLGHFHLTHLLVPVMITTAKTSAAVRILSTSSGLHLLSGRISLDSLTSPTRTFPIPAIDSIFRYARSKLANILHMRELARQLAESGVSGITVNTYYPGNIVTPAMQAWPALLGPLGRLPCWLFSLIGQTLEEGATTAMFLVTSPLVEGRSGGYWTPVARLGTASRASEDAAAARDLWRWSEAMMYKMLDDGQMLV
ncbi:hypothetical protein EDC01DRAFT_245340 [Geopyxis carbonaria]|nr:hypothetical protein EDC01DRAFT_245340 [Geopyxis carbonaria]